MSFNVRKLHPFTRSDLLTLFSMQFLSVYMRYTGWENIKQIKSSAFELTHKMGVGDLWLPVLRVESHHIPTPEHRTQTRMGHISYFHFTQHRSYQWQADRGRWAAIKETGVQLVSNMCLTWRETQQLQK